MTGQEARDAVHWIGDAPTSLHGNGAASFERTTRDAAEVTCKLCISQIALETPTSAQEARDDEREADRIAALDARQEGYRRDREEWWVHHENAPEETGGAFFRGWDAAAAHSARKHPEPEITEAPNLSDPAVVYELVNEHVTLPGVVEHARRQAEWCCEKGCGTGACESCPCCAAGWCVSGIDGIPDESEGFDQWLEVASEHNPLAARLQAALRVPVGEGEQG